MPTFIYQVHDDILTEPEDVQAMYDNIPVAEKKLQWIEGTKARWDGYLIFLRTQPGWMRHWRSTTRSLIERVVASRGGCVTWASPSTRHMR